MTGRVRTMRVLRPLVGLAAAAVVTVALAQVPASGAFSATTGSTGNSVGSAASFCTLPGSGNGTLTDDVWFEENNPGIVGDGTHQHLHVKAQTGANRRSLLRFTLPSVPSGCQVSSATLRIYNNAAVGTRTIGAYRVDPAAPLWVESNVSWSTQPAYLPGPATSTGAVSGAYQQWTVTTLVQDIYASPRNNGFLLRDQDETGPGITNRYDSKDLLFPSPNTTTSPQLLVVWD